MIAAPSPVAAVLLAQQNHHFEITGVGVTNVCETVIERFLHKMQPS
jgi:hypothetical protein